MSSYDRAHARNVSIQIAQARVLLAVYSGEQLYLEDEWIAFDNWRMYNWHLIESDLRHAITVQEDGLLVPSYPEMAKGGSDARL
jgi:hypothetical protein